MEVIQDGDQFFETLWQMIDEAQTNVWILTYHMVKNDVPNETLRRLISAANRGVNVVLYIDWINYWPDPILIQKLIDSGGTVRALNPMDPISRLRGGQELFTKELFERYHQKVFLIDNNVIIGSANLDNAYAGERLGTSQFYDFNVILKGHQVTEVRQIFQNISDRYNWTLPKIPDVQTTLGNQFSILVSEPNALKWEIQQKVINKMDKAKSRIVLLQGYYLEIPKMTQAIQRALDRGVAVEMITTGFRDQPCYKQIKNCRLTSKLRAMGVKVYEYDPSKVLHVKGYIMDDKTTLGSFNHDWWSWGINNELNLYIRDKAITEDILKRLNVIKER